MIMNLDESVDCEDDSCENSPCGTSGNPFGAICDGESQTDRTDFESTANVFPGGCVEVICNDGISNENPNTPTFDTYVDCEDPDCEFQNCAVEGAANSATCGI